MSRRCLPRKARQLYRNHDEPLEPPKAQWVLESYWHEVVVPAFRSKGMRAPENIRSLRIDPRAHDNCRHFAGTSLEGDQVVVAPELASMPDGTVIAILAHEAGHVQDLANPGVYWFRPERAFFARNGIDYEVIEPITPKGRVLIRCLELPSKGFNKHLDDWKHRGREEEEHLADALAEYALGIRIGYVGPHSCLVETIGAGVPRPAGLR